MGSFSVMTSMGRCDIRSCMQSMPCVMRPCVCRPRQLKLVSYKIPMIDKKVIVIAPTELWTIHGVRAVQGYENVKLCTKPRCIKDKIHVVIAKNEKAWRSRKSTTIPKRWTIVVPPPCTKILWFIVESTTEAEVLFMTVEITNKLVNYVGVFLLPHTVSPSPSTLQHHDGLTNSNIWYQNQVSSLYQPPQFRPILLLESGDWPQLKHKFRLWL